MYRQATYFLLCAMLSSTAAAAPPEAPPRPAGLIVHEWGTFTSMQGSDGVVLEGLHHEEEDLPAFVYDRSRSPELYREVSKKMETPVTYFYPPGRMKVDVRVGFPEGLLTQWYPAASAYAPALGTSGESVALRGGELSWRGLELLPAALAAQLGATLAATAADDPWNHARQVDAAVVRAPGPRGPQHEKMLFYRGLGRFAMPVRVTSAGDGRLAIRNASTDDLRGLLLLQVDGDGGRFEVVGSLAAGARLAVAEPIAGGAAEPLATLVPRLQRALVELLTAEGLYGREAWAMVRTWTRSYFRTPGLRLLYMVPRRLTDQVIPLAVTPAPLETVRVMVARVECLTAGHELRIERAIRDLGARRYVERTRAQRTLWGLGRFAEPNLRRALARSRDPEVRGRASQLLEALYPGR